MTMTCDMPIKCALAPRADSDEWAEARHRVMLVRDSRRRTIELRIVPPGITYAGFVVAIERLPNDPT